MVPAREAPLWPHLALARAKRGERRVRPIEDGAAATRAHSRPASVTLYRSTLRPQGALYETLARTVLAGMPAIPLPTLR